MKKKMKAIDLVHAMCYDPGLASGCTWVYDGSVSLRDYFGAVRHDGEMLHGEYFYFYVESGQTSLAGVGMPVPDVVIETEYKDNILLWKLED